MELGSEFNLRVETLKEAENTIYEFLKGYHTIYLDSGRSALKLLCSDLREGEILLPQYLCESVLDCFKGRNLSFYKLNKDLQIELDNFKSKLTKHTSVVYLMHYFGAIQSPKACQEIKKLKEKYGFIIIEDTTHSLFSKPMTIGDYCICSLRKWFAIPDGGVLYSKNSLEKYTQKVCIHNTDIKKAYGMLLKTLYLDGVMDCNSVYRKIFLDSDMELEEKKEITLLSELSGFLLSCYDCSSIVNRRILNYQILLKGLEALGFNPLCEIATSCCPFTFPIRIKNRDALRSYLMDHKIYCAVHWPLEDTALYKVQDAQILSKEILSLPIDQRYSEPEIKYLINIIIAYKEEY